MFSARRDGVSLRVLIDGPSYESGSYGTGRFVDCSAIHTEGRLSVFAINRSESERAPLAIRVLDKQLLSLESAELLTGPDPKAHNSFERPEVIRPVPLSDVEISDHIAALELPPLSLAAMTFKLA